MNQLKDEDIEGIADAYVHFKDVEKYSKLADLDSIRANDYNLNVTRYADVLDDEELIDVAKTWHELKRLESERQQVDERVQNYLKELGYEK